ncbi:MAG: TetR/AcrR family transcriptional regulator [Hyphomonadaceae bacterium]
MARAYTLKRRAEQQAETRRRIVEAAVDLHSTVGPADTTISMIAERAGVQRHTLYAHFPDERSIFMACSGHVMERDPLPDSAPWRALKPGEERLLTGLREIYDWFARNAAVIGATLRDGERHALTREINTLRLGPSIAAYHEVLGAKLNAKQRAMLALALSFHTWRTLTAEGGLKQAAAAAAMARAVTDAR